jgi:NAD(P)H-hydrate epimerase
MQIATAEQMRAIDRKTVDGAGIPSLVLMERAGMAVYERLSQMLVEPGSIAVVCGKGNNGGDGFVVARLALSHGHYVDCLAACAEADLSVDATHALAGLRAAGCEPCFADHDFWKSKLESLAAHDLVVDALLGTGTRGEVKGNIEEAIHAINNSEALVVSIDIPSGIDTDTGVELGTSVVADATVTLGLPKPFVFCRDGLEHRGDWTVADIGLCASTDALDEVVEPSWVAERLPIRDLGSNKGANGHVLVVAGSHLMRGAATLCSLAALRAGAGLVTVAAPEEVIAAVAAQLPEVLFLALDDDPVRTILEYQSKVDVGLFGPGLGQSGAVREMLANVFAEWSRPALVDADALNALSKGVKLPNAPCVLTPHPGEMSRLLNSSVKEIEANRFQTARSAAVQFGQTVVLKGGHTIVAAPGEPLLVNQTGNPGLATGGSGDMLSGVIASLLGQGLGPRDAAACGVYLAGLSADLCASQIGSVGYLPTEVAFRLPEARDILFDTCEN